GAFGPVAALLGDADDRLAAFAQHARREREAPAREVLHRRLADERGEALAERRARQRYLVCKLVYGPGLRRRAMQQRERASDLRIAHAGEPALALRRQLHHVAPQRFDQEPP